MEGVRTGSIRHQVFDLEERVLGAIIGLNRKVEAEMSPCPVGVQIRFITVPAISLAWSIAPESKMLAAVTRKMDPTGVMELTASPDRCSRTHAVQ
jgi:hypothetical protein